MGGVDEQEAVAEIHEIVVADVRRYVGVGSEAERVGYEFAAGAGAECHCIYRFRPESGGAHRWFVIDTFHEGYETVAVGWSRQMPYDSYACGGVGRARRQNSHVGKSEPPAHFVRQPYAGGHVGGSVARIDGYPAAYGLDGADFGLRVAGQVFQPAENERVVRYNEVASAALCLSNYLRCDIHTQKHPGAFCTGVATCNLQS